MPATITLKDGRTLTYKPARSIQVNADWITLQDRDGRNFARVGMQDVSRYGFEDPIVKPARRQKAGRQASRLPVNAV